MSSFHEIPVSAIKVRIPPWRRELIARPRLTEQLYAHLDKALLFVIAPAGYGKTSFLVDVSNQVDMPVCWLSLDGLDQDPQRFLRYVIAALAERFPAFGRDSLAVLGNMTSLAADQEQILVTLTNEITMKIHDHFLLVLDDFHLVEEERMIRQLLGRFLQLCGENVHLVISSRNLPDLPVSPLLIARNQAGGISFEDLSFQVDEIQTLFRQNRGLEINNEEAQSILRDTEGWVAAIHLSNGISTNLPNFRPLHSTTALFDFFSREVMQRQSDDVRRFMYMTSIFDAFDIALCERVLSPLLTETSLDYSTLFRQVQSAADIFSVPLDQDGNWIRYHHLFQHFLRSQLQYEEPVLAWSIQQKLAQVYEQDQKFEEALQIYERLNDYQNQIRLLISTGADFIGAGRILTLDTWLRKIPVELAYAQPALLSLMGAVHTTQGDQRQARQLLDVAEQQQKETSDKLEWFKTLVRRAEVFRQLGQFQDALLDVDQITEIEGEEKDVRALIIYAEVRRVRGLALFGLGRANEALAWLEESLQRYRQLGQDQQIPILETELGVIHRRLGDVGAAARYYANALAALEHSGNSGWKARLLNNMGMLKYMTGQMEEAYHLLQESVQTAKLSGYIRIQTNALISLGDLLCDINDLDNAFNYYDLALTQATELGHSLYIFYASLGEVRLKRLHGDAIAALTELRQVELSQIKLGSFERAFFNLERGLCLLDAKREVEALAAFRLASDLFLEGGNQAEGKIAQLWIAAALSFSDTRSAIAEMRKLLPPQREWTISTPFMLHAGRASRFLKLTGQTRLLRDADLRVFFEHAVHVQDSLPILSKETSVLHGSSTSREPRLEIQTFGRIQVFNNGKVLELSDWQTREARDLFIYLLQSPPRTKEQIAIDFWPDLPPARIKVRFKINIYRIRQALGQDVILFKDDRYTFNRSIAYQWDRERLEDLIQRSHYDVGAREQIVDLEQALHLLRAGYLIDVDAEWATIDRNRYREQLRQLLMEVAELELKQGNGQTCLELTRELLSLEPLLEAAHRLMLQAYAAQHDPAGLALQYRQYQEILENELGMLPSVEMRKLYEKLMTTI